MYYTLQSPGELIYELPAGSLHALRDDMRTRQAGHHFYLRREIREKPFSTGGQKRGTFLWIFRHMQGTRIEKRAYEGGGYPTASRSAPKSRLRTPDFRKGFEISPEPTARGEGAKRLSQKQDRRACEGVSVPRLPAISRKRSRV